MSDLKKLLCEEAEHAEAHKDATLAADARITRPGRDRAKVLSVRLNPDEYSRLAQQAEASGVGHSTLARSLILSALNGPSIESISARLALLEQQVVDQG